MIESFSQVWDKLEIEFNQPLTEDLRKIIGSTVQLYIEEKIDWPRLVGILSDVLPGLGLPPRRRARVGGMHDLQRVTHQRSVDGLTRQSLRMEIVAEHATEDPEVIRFRGEILGGILLEWGAIHEWITQQQTKERDLPGACFDKVPLPLLKK